MEQLTMKLETILEVVRVKQEVMERPVEYRTGMVSSSYAGNFGIKEIGDEASEVVLVVVLNMKNEINAIHRVFTGSLNTSVAHPREIFRTAIINNGAKIITILAGDIQTMPGLAKNSNYLNIDVKNEEIIGII